MKNNMKISNPSKKELKSFGLIMGVILIGFFGAIFAFIFENLFSLIFFILGMGFIFMACFFSEMLRPVYIIWMKFGLFMNRITTPILLGIVFYFFITPLAMVMRLFGKEVLQLKFDKDTITYRVQSIKRTRESMEKPF